MSSLRSWVVIAAAYLASVAASTGALAGAKDESAAEWLAPKWLNQWHDGLAAKGLNFGATYIADNIGNVSGGVARGAIHLGRLDLSVDADLEKLFGWTGGRFYTNSFGIYGRGLTRNYILNLATISEIEALPDTRLYNAYFEQSFFNNAVSIRLASRRRMSSSSTARPTICSSTVPSAGRPSRPPTFRPAARHRRSRCPGFASRLHFRTRSPPLVRFSTAVQQRPATATRNFATITARAPRSGEGRSIDLDDSCRVGRNQLLGSGSDPIPNYLVDLDYNHDEFLADGDVVTGCVTGCRHSERRGTKHGHTELRGQRGNVDHLAFGNDAHGVLDTAGETNERHPQS